MRKKISVQIIKEKIIVVTKDNSFIIKVINVMEKFLLYPNVTEKLLQKIIIKMTLL
jgi:hypothetical protein